MRNNDDSPMESTPVWDIPGDVPAARRRRAQASSGRPDPDGREKPPTPDPQSGPYDQRSVRPAMLEQMLSRPHGLKRTKGTLGGPAVLLVAAALLGVYAGQPPDNVSVVADAAPDLPAGAHAEMSTAAEPHKALETPSVVPVADVSQVHPVSATASMPEPAASPRVIEHVVKKGDTLWDLAEHYTQDPFRYPELARLSHIQDPDLIYPGQIVRIEPVT